MNATPLQAPFPYFGGKRRAAEAIWAALGDVGGYVEPFAGSAAVLLARPKARGRRVETINDADGWLVNAWRSIQISPADTARHALGPMTEIDYHARLAWLQERRTDDLVSWLEGDPEAHDPKAAGWWLYVMAAGIGDPWGRGPWQVVDGRLVNTKTPPAQRVAGVNRELPHLGSAGQGINRALPYLGSAGRGVKRGSLVGDPEEALIAYMENLSARLAHVRITAGDWRRVLTPAAVEASATNSTIGVFLDPPYATSGDLYASTNSGDDGHLTISAEVREWCLTKGAGKRIVLCGYEDEHDDLLEHGWTVEAGKSGSGSGYSTDPDAGKRERLWLSPECVRAQQTLDLGMIV